MNRKQRRKQKREKKRARRADPAVPGLLRGAHASLDAGDLAAAETGFRDVTLRDPLGAEAYHMLALIAYHHGRLIEAGDNILEAITRDDSDVAMHVNCGAIMNLLGRPWEAEAACRHVIEMEPDHAEAHNNLAVALEVQGKLDDALAAGADAIRINPDYAEAHINLGNIKLRMGEVAAAIESYRAAIAAEPGKPMARANLGVALREAGELEAAEAECRRAIEIDPGYPEAHNSLGNVLKAKGDLAGARAAFAAALECRTGYLEARLNLAAAAFQDGDADAAEAGYSDALAFKEDLAEAHLGLGVVRLAAGRLEDAIGSFREAVKIKPGLGEAQYNLATAVGADLSLGEIATIRDLLDDGTQPEGERVKLHFALAEAAHGKGDWAAAFAEYKAGNDLRRDLLKRAGRAFDADSHDQFIDRVASVLGAEFLEGKTGLGDPSSQPVFIVGMPRSGTTLAEQIAASHPQVAGRGEMDLIRQLLGDDPAAARDFDDGAYSQAAADYLARLGAGTGDGGGDGADGGDPAPLGIIDKTPFNFLYLGAIQVLFPNSRVIHCQRDPVDTGLSCYFQNFTSPHAWACDLGDIGRYQRAYGRLMDHWREVLSLPVFELRYEDLIADQEGTSRRLIEFLGLDWDPACLDFHKSGRTVLTASNWQVRKPLYTAAVGRAKAYEEFLGPLRDGLGGRAFST